MSDDMLNGLSEFIELVRSGDFYKDYDLSMELLGKADDALKAFNCNKNDHDGADVGVKQALDGWLETYASFTGAFDTPLARRRDSDEFSEDARKRMRTFNEAVMAALSRPAPVAANASAETRLRELETENARLKAQLIANGQQSSDGWD